MLRHLLLTLLLFLCLFVVAKGQATDSTDYKKYISLKDKITVDKDKEGVSKVQYHRYEGIIQLLDYLISEEQKRFKLNEGK